MYHSVRDATTPELRDRDVTIIDIKGSPYAKNTHFLAMLSQFTH